MKTANQKTIIDTDTHIHTHKKKQPKHNNSHQIPKELWRKGRENTYKNKSKTIKKTTIRTYKLISTLNVNRLNAPFKRHGLAE